MIDTGCDEYDRIKNRYHNKSVKYLNKTARVKEGVSCSCCWNGPESQLEHGNLISKDGVMTLTRIDELFGSINNHKKSLGKKNRWELVMNELNESAVEVQEKFSRQERGLHTVFSVPVLSRTFVSGKGPHVGFGPRWLSWKGVSHNPANLYIVVSKGGEDQLKALCPSSESPAVFGSDYAVAPIRFKVSKANNQHVTSETKFIIPMKESAVYQWHCASRLQSIPPRLAITPENSLNSGIIIDLKAVHLVTHLAFRGHCPTTLTFPRQYYGLEGDTVDLEKDPDTTASLLNMRRRRRHSRRGVCSGAQVQVLKDEPNSLPRVTSFDLYRKELVSGKWVKVGALSVAPTHHGITSTVVDLKAAGAFNCGAGLRSRFIKLIPTSWHISPVFRVMVYGKKLGVGVETAKQLAANRGIYSSALLRSAAAGADEEGPQSRRKFTKRQQRQQVRDEAVYQESDMPVETVRYTLKPAVHHNWKLDGAYNAGYRDPYFENEQRQQQLRFVNDCMKDLDYC